MASVLAQKALGLGLSLYRMESGLFDCRVDLLVQDLRLAFRSSPNGPQTPSGPSAATGPCGCKGAGLQFRGLGFRV